MYLRIIKHNQLNEFIFRINAIESETYLEDYLQKIFTKIGKGIYKVELKNLHELNQAFMSFKEHFVHFLRDAPPPFSLLLIPEVKGYSLTTVLRPGKIYFHPDLKEHIKKALSEVKVHYRIERWQDLMELVFPSTVDPKLDLFYKDIFWSEGKNFCFFCNSTWHSSYNCPGLKDPSPFKTFLETLQMNFLELSETIWEGIRKEEFSFEKLKYFYTRHFYLFPQFLKIIFFKGNAISTWSQLDLGTEVPVQGGSLEIGLDALIKGNLELAEKNFSEVEDDVRASLGLMFVNVLKDDLPKALYFLENAFSSEANSFVISFLLFLKGYLFEKQGDDTTALEFYKKAFDIDRTCLPAFYRSSLLKYIREEESIEKILSYFNHPYFLYWSYLEPMLIKEQKSIEEFIEKKLLERKETASQRLKEAEDLFHNLKTIMSSDEKKEYEERLKKLGDDIYRGGIVTIEKASDKALDLVLELRAYVYNKTKIVKAQLEEIKKEYETLALFWQNYPYQAEDFVFGKQLKSLAELINKILKKLKSKDVSGALHVLLLEIQNCKKNIASLNEMKKDLHKKWIFRKRLAEFIKNFSILESLLVLFYLISSIGTFGSISNFLNFPLFLLFSFIFLIICLITAYFKHYE